MSRFIEHLTYSDFHIRMLLLVVPTAIAGLIAVWAASSRRHWFWRALAVCLSILPLLPIRAYEPAFVWFMTMPMIILLVRFLEYRRSPRDATQRLHLRMRIKLQDMLLFVVIFALVLQIWLQVSTNVAGFWEHRYLLTAATITIVTVLASRIVSVKEQRLRTAVLLVCAIPGGAFAIPALGRAGWENIWGVVGVTFLAPWKSRDDVATVALALIELGLLVAIVTGLVRTSHFHSSRLVRRFAGTTLTVLSFCVAIPLAAVYPKMVGFAEFPADFTGEKNNFVQLTELGRRILLVKGSTVINQGRSGLMRLYCRDAVNLLDAPSYIAYTPKAERDVWKQSGDRSEYINAMSNSYNTICQDNVPAILALSKVLKDQASLALIDDADEYAKLTSAHLRLCAIMMRGGLIDETYQALTVQADIQAQLAETRHYLSAKGAQQIIASLQWIETECEPASVILARDTAYMQQRWGWPERLKQILPGPTIDRSVPYLEIATPTRTFASLLKTELALQLFHAEHSRWPNQLDELVPSQLKSIPLDPYSDQPLHYRFEGDTYVLYSVGPDQHDDGGKFASKRNEMWADGYDVSVLRRLP
jgi:hypothetical protein